MQLARGWGADLRSAHGTSVAHENERHP